MHSFLSSWSRQSAKGELRTTQSGKGQNDVAPPSSAQTRPPAPSGVFPCSTFIFVNIINISFRGFGAGCGQLPFQASAVEQSRGGLSSSFLPRVVKFDQIFYFVFLIMAWVSVLMVFVQSLEVR